MKRLLETLRSPADAQWQQRARGCLHGRCICPAAPSQVACGMVRFQSSDLNIQGQIWGPWDPFALFPEQLPTNKTMFSKPMSFCICCPFYFCFVRLQSPEQSLSIHFSYSFFNCCCKVASFQGAMSSEIHQYAMLHLFIVKVNFKNHVWLKLFPSYTVRLLKYLQKKKSGLIKPLYTSKPFHHCKWKKIPVILNCYSCSSSQTDQ